METMLEEILRDGFDSLGLSCDADMLARYRLYYERLREVNQVMNLTAITDEEDTARLHFLDCAALLCAFSPADGRVIDVGTGAGFPGLAMKIACPSLSLTLLDSLDKRVGFLRDTCARLGFPDVACIHARAEEADPALRECFDYAVSRAVARLNVLCELCLPFVRPGGLFAAMKGPDCAGELAEAAHSIAALGGQLERCIPYTVPGTDVTHSIVLIRKRASTPAKYPRRWAQIKKQPL